MEIDKIKDVKQLKAMIHATRSHLARMASDIEHCTPDVMGEMQLDLMRLKLRLEELSPDSLSDEGE